MFVVNYRRSRLYGFSPCVARSSETSVNGATNEPAGTFISLGNSINLAFFTECFIAIHILSCRVFPYCTVKSFDVWPQIYKCPGRFLKTLKRPDIPHSTWSLINKECTCSFDTSKENISFDLLHTCFRVSPYSFRKVSNMSTSLNTLLAHLLTVNSSC